MVTSRGVCEEAVHGAHAPSVRSCGEPWEQTLARGKATHQLQVAGGP